MADNLYSFDIRLVATVYVKAKNRNEALRKARALHLGSIEIGSAVGDVPISELKFDDPNLPEISLSPAMTIYQPLPGSGELVAESREHGKPDDL